MKSLNRWVATGLFIVFVVGLMLGTAHAESKSKKKKKKVVEHTSSVSLVKSNNLGVNNIGRPGYFFSDTAFTPNQNQFTGAAGIQFYSLGSQLNIPFGGSFGITPNIQVHVSENFYTATGASGLGNLVFGGKYKFDIPNKELSIAGGLDLSVGPLTNSAYSTFNFDPYGIVTYNFDDGLQLNGQLGIYVPGGYTVGGTTIYGIKIPAISYTPPAYLQLNAGASYPVADNLTGIAEIDINGLGSSNTPLIVGIRTGKDIQLQAFGGLDLAGSVGILLGGSVALISQ
jgi:hypothetical protein